MSEMSDMFKLVNQMELAKKARVGTSLTYFDVIELLGELNSLYEYIAELEAMVERLVEVGDRLSDSLCTYPEEEKTIEVMNWNAIVAEYKEREKNG